MQARGATRDAPGRAEHHRPDTSIKIPIARRFAGAKEFESDIGTGIAPRILDLIPGGGAMERRTRVAHLAADELAADELMSPREEPAISCA